MTNHRYWSSNCKGCPLKDKCTPSSQRRVTRWEHQDVLDEMQARLEQTPNAMRIRRSRLGSTHFASLKELQRGRQRIPCGYRRALERYPILITLSFTARQPASSARCCVTALSNAILSTLCAPHQSFRSADLKGLCSCIADHRTFASTSDTSYEPD